MPSREDAERAIETLREYMKEHGLWSVDIFEPEGIDMFRRKSPCRSFRSTGNALDWAEQQRGGQK